MAETGWESTLRARPALVAGRRSPPGCTGRSCARSPRPGCRRGRRQPVATGRSSSRSVRRSADGGEVGHGDGPGSSSTVGGGAHGSIAVDSTRPSRVPRGCPRRRRAPARRRSGWAMVSRAHRPPAGAAQRVGSWHDAAELAADMIPSPAAAGACSAAAACPGAGEDPAGPPRRPDRSQQRLDAHRRRDVGQGDEAVEVVEGEHGSRACRPCR